MLWNFERKIYQIRLGVLRVNGEIPNPGSAELKEVQESGTSSCHEICLFQYTRQRKRFVEDWLMVQDNIYKRYKKTLLRRPGNRKLSAQESRSTQTDGVL